VAWGLGNRDPEAEWGCRGRDPEMLGVRRFPEAELEIPGEGCKLIEGDLTGRVDASIPMAT